MTLSITVTQPPCVLYDVEANAATHAATIRRAGTRLVVFPELSLTGYTPDAPAITPTDPRLAPIIEACAATNTLALVGAPVGDHIAMLAINGTSATLAYSKIYLGGTEPEHFAPGTEPSVLHLDGWRLGLAICKDAGVPQHSSDTAALGIDLYVAAVCELPEDVPVIDQRARRIATTHHVPVAIASFAGPAGAPYNPAAGRSGFWTLEGTITAQAGPDPGDMVTWSVPRS